MRYTIERLPESRVAIDVELEAEVVEKALERASQRLSRRHPIRGFRPGKAPRRVVEAVYGRGALYEEAADELIARAYAEILQQKEFEPVAEATLDAINYEPFSFRLVVPVEPTVTLCDYRSLRFPLEPEPVTEEQIDARIEELRLAQLVWREPEPPRPAALGDRCLVDMRLRYEDGTEKSYEDVDVVLEAGSFLPGLAEGLVGAQVGEVREIEIAFPEDVANQALAGHKVHATVTVRAIRAPELPPLDDDWARSLGREETLAELRARIRREMEEEALKKARAKVIGQMIDAIQEQSTIDVPEVLVEREAERVADDLARLLVRAGTSERFLKAQSMRDKELRDKYMALARAQLRRTLVLSEIIRAEQLEVTPEEVQQELAALADEGEEDDEERLVNARGRVLIRKLEERLLDIALGRPLEGATSEELPGAGEREAAGAAETNAAQFTAGTGIPAEPAAEV